MRISPIVDYSMKNTTSIVVESGLTNAVIVEVNGRKAMTSRPPLLSVYNAALYSLTGAGRGAFYWESNSTMYHVIGGSVYRTGFSASTLVGNLTADAKERVYIAQCGSRLILIDPQNNDGWTITTGHVLTKITDADFPTTLAHGLVVLNGSAYVLDDNGNIYGSAIDDPTSWSALNFINAERSPDGGTFIAGISDHIVVAGKNTIEVFYDAGNASGSPLNRREDFALKIGVSTSGAQSFATSGDLLFFVAENGQGGQGVFVMEGISVPRKISNEAIEYFISRVQLISNNSFVYVGAVFNDSGHIYYSMSVMYPASTTDYGESATYVYDLRTGLWGKWSTTITGMTTFPIMSYVNQNSAVQPGSGGVVAFYYNGYGIARNGDIISIGSTSDLYTIDIITFHGGVSSSFAFTAQLDTGQIDHGTSNNKKCSFLRVVAEKTATNNNYSISYADGNNASYSTARTVGSLYPGRRLARFGQFRRRNWRLSWTASATVGQQYVEGIDVEIEACDS